MTRHHPSDPRTALLQHRWLNRLCRNGLARAGAPFDAFFAFCARIRSLSQGVYSASNA